MGQKINMAHEEGRRTFLRYALPVLGICSAIPISPEEIASYHAAVRGGSTLPTIKRLTQLFPNAIPHLKSWKDNDVRDYWTGKEGHNKVVEDNPFCQVYRKTVTKVIPAQGSEPAKVRVGGTTSIETYASVNPGDEVYVHNRVAVEKA